MKKVVIEKAGGYEQLKLQEFPDSVPGKGEVLIETKACGVNFADCLVRMGVYASARDLVGWPITPGFEVTGVITEVGKDVTKFKAGQEVIAVTRFGGYTTHLCVSEDYVFPMPRSLNFQSAVGIPAVFLTAYYALFELAHVRKNDKILVHSAAGGVGGALVQLGRIAECQVIGVVGSTHKVEAVKNFGASGVIDKSRQDLWAEAERFAPDGYDVVLDANGVQTLRQSYEHLGVGGGKLVVYGFHTMFTKGRGTPNYFKIVWDYLRTPRFDPLNMTTHNRSVLAFNLSYLFDKKELFQEAMTTILKLVEEKKIIPPPIKTYWLDDVGDAHFDLESGRTVGKLILVPKERQ